MGTSSLIPESIAIRLIADKPVRKTPYQVKGVFMKEFSEEKIVPFLDGKLRNKYLYPRVQVKILNEQIYIIGIKEGVEPIISIIDNVKSFNFGNITINIDSYEIEENIDQFKVAEKLFRYKFITPWVALNKSTSGEYRFLSNQEKPLYLNKLLGQNLLFIAKEVGEEIKTKIYTKVITDANVPEKIDDNGWSSFTGEFKTNFILPSYIGLGNGITRGYGTLFSLNNPNIFKTQSLEENIDDYLKEEINEEDELMTFVTIDDAPVIKRKKHKKRSNNYKRKRRNNRLSNNKYSNRKKLSKNKKNNDINDETRFNSEEYHKKQHDL
jgi:hypothetical protein|tara:strand:+ start:805 stop:1776 length:972 start_codon:yes stop_codon:yes gene_type:complete